MQVYSAVITPLGTFYTTPTDKTTIEKVQEGIELLFKAGTPYLTIHTDSGPVILGEDLLRRSAVQILTVN